jgi:glycosyltransferase involved in cell wall biosynthesis
MPAFSVIIPAYNAARFIERCLRSLQVQTFPDWEAICVDDGSKDSTGGILDRFAAEDSRFRVLHKPNGGVGAARNDAMSMAEGEYVLFLDSDDFLHPQMMEICHTLAEKDGSDVVAFNYDHAYRNRIILRHALHLPEHMDFPRFRTFNEYETVATDDIFDWATEYTRHDRKLATRHCQPWRRIYRRDLVGGIEWMKGVIYEDFPWWSEVMLRIRRATLTGHPLYFYYPNRGSYILSSREDFKIKSLQKVIRAAEKVYENADPRIRERWEREFLKPFQAKLAKKEKHLPKR